MGIYRKLLEKELQKIYSKIKRVLQAKNDKYHVEVESLKSKVELIVHFLLFVHIFWSFGRVEKFPIVSY